VKKGPSSHPADPSSKLNKIICGLLKEWSILKNDLCYSRADRFAAFFVLKLERLKNGFWPKKNHFVKLTFAELTSLKQHVG
jgi:hypothetical protein